MQGPLQTRGYMWGRVCVHFVPLVHLARHRMSFRAATALLARLRIRWTSLVLFRVPRALPEAGRITLKLPVHHAPPAQRPTLRRQQAQSHALLALRAPTAPCRPLRAQTVRLAA
eukprot:COSAG05_NODE_6030_length_1038_cov_11.218118_2_plen_114_part_00